MAPSRRVSVKAFAKVNVTLRVLGVRPDGYHELRTVFQALALHDRLTLDVVPGPFRIETDDPHCPTDRTNLVWRAAELVWRAARRPGTPAGVRVRIAKRIPVQAGLGGGSSDAAAALRALSSLWAPGLDGPQLARLGATLGADVPFFFTGGTALGLERGDRLFALADAPPAFVALARPDFGVATADAYRWFDTEARRRPRASAPAGPYGDGGNDLERAVAARHPAIRRLVKGLMGHGAEWAAMSGSGSVCFGLYADAAAARRAATALASPACRTLVTRTLTRRQYAAGVRPVER